MTKRNTQKKLTQKYQVSNHRLRANVKYKDTLFHMLYKEKKIYYLYIMQLMKKLYTSLSELSLEDSVKRAVNECIKEGILSEFLLKNKAEVIKMSIYEYDKEFEEKKLRKAEFEYGQHELLKTQIQKKLAKGKSINEFADALEGSPLVIQNFINELKYEKAHSELNL